VGDDREDIAEELRRVRDEARRRARAAEPGETEPPPATAQPPVRAPRGPRPEAPVAAEPPPDPPDNAAVNAAWRAEAPASRGLSGRVRRLLERLLGPRLEAQRAFNARQVQLDNEMLEYLEKRRAATHRHYDRLLGELGRRLDEADERHAILERELVGHVQDLVRRIDLVLTDGSRGRGALEFALEEVRERLARLERALRRPE
jgi:hypothetical protein